MEADNEIIDCILCKIEDILELLSPATGNNRPMIPLDCPCYANIGIKCGALRSKNDHNYLIR